MAAAERFGIGNQLIEVEPNGRVVGGDDGPGADADDAVDRNSVENELPKNADVRGAAKAAGAQDDADADTLAFHTGVIMTRRIAHAC